MISHRASLDRILNTDVAALNGALRDKKIPNVIVAYTPTASSTGASRR